MDTYIRYSARKPSDQFRLKSHLHVTYWRMSIIIGNKQNRGLGYGAKIIRLMIDAIQKEIPTKQVELRVFGYNTNAIKLYKKEGFVIQEKHTLQFQYTDDESWTNYYMAKQLNN